MGTVVGVETRSGVRVPVT